MKAKKKLKVEETAASPNKDAAIDVNAVLTPEPLLDVTADEAAIGADLKELLPSINKGDTLTPATWVALKALGWEGKASKEEKVVKSTKTPKKKKEKQHHSDSMKITIIKGKEPKKEGTAVFARFEKYRKTKTVGNYVKEGGAYSDISFDIYHERVKLD